MSKSLGLEVLKPDYNGSRIPVMEHIRALSREAVIHFTDIDPLTMPNRIEEAYQKLAEILEIDLVWGGGLPDNTMQTFDWNDPTPKFDEHGNRLVQWGVTNAVAQEDGRHFLHIPRINSVQEALSFEPLEYFPKTVEEYYQEFQALHVAINQNLGDRAYGLPYHYTTCFHWALGIFGFELLCEAGMEDEKRFHTLMAKFAEITLRITTAWAQIDGLKSFIMHDDLTISSGPIFCPQWYRDHIFCHYPKLFKPFIDKDIPIIFTSDGDCSLFVDDLFEAGASGLNFEYLVDMETIAKKYPDKILIGNLNSATLAGGSIEKIEQEVTACIEAGKHCRRFVMNVGGGLTHDISVENLEAYLTLRKKLCRQARSTQTASA